MFKLRAKGLEEQYFRTVEADFVNKIDEVKTRLASIGLNTAKTYVYSSVVIDNPSDINVYAEMYDNGFAIVAEGEQVAFVEFGAGVYFNHGNSYKGERPEGIVGIGEFGQGKGKQNTWGYYDEAGNLRLTHGNPPSNAMYYTGKAIEDNIKKVVKEVFR